MSEDLRDAGVAQPQVVVLGMHRSGTSALTGALSAMGVFVGDEPDLTGKSWENPQGFFERRDARKICDTLLHSADADWWKISKFRPDDVDHATARVLRQEIKNLVQALDGSGRTWALKEPRLCLLFPIFRSALARPFALVAYRHPLEVARSLRRRNGFPIQAGLALWEAYTLLALRYGRALNHHIVSFDQLVNDPEHTLGQLSAALEAVGAQNLNLDAGVATINPSLRRESMDGGNDGSALSEAQRELWSRLVAGSFEELPQFSAESESVLREFEVDERERHRLRSEVKTAQAELFRVRSDAEKRVQDELTKERHALRAETALRKTMLEQEKELRAALEQTQEELRSAHALAQSLHQETETQRSQLVAQTASLHAEFRQMFTAYAQEAARLSSEREHFREKEARLTVEMASTTHETKELEARLLRVEQAFAREVEQRREQERGRFWSRVRRLVRRALGRKTLRERQLEQSKRRILASGLFDAEWYLEQYPDVAAAGVHPVEHYLRHGAAEGRDPSQHFSSRGYLRAYEDVARAGVNPLLHFLSSGKAEGRSQKPAIESMVAGRPAPSAQSARPRE